MFSRSLKSLNTQTLKMSTSPLKKYFILNYKYVDNVVEKRAPIRNDHLSFAKKYVDDGRLLLGGAFTDPIDGAAIVFKTESKSEVEEFARNDPYVVNGIVTQWGIREWTVVVEANSNGNK